MSINLADVPAWIDEHWHVDQTVGAWWRQLADAGLAFPTWPEGLGGYDASPAEAREIQQALGAAGVIGPPSGNGPNMGAPTLIAHGTPEQQRRLVLPMARGEHAWAQLFSEPGAGSDLANIATRAERDGEEFVLTGQKVWNSRAEISRFGMLLARTDPTSPKHQGITFMLIDMSQPGVDVRPLMQMNGAADFCEVFLTEARVPVNNVIGEINGGWNVARLTLDLERAAAAKGKARGTIDVLAGQDGGNWNVGIPEALKAAEAARLDPTKRTEVVLNFRTMLDLARRMDATSNPAIRDPLMHFYCSSEIYRLTGRRAAVTARTGGGPDGSIMKLKLAQLSHESRDLSLLMLGAQGMMAGADSLDGGRFHRAAMSAFAPSFGGGTNEIQRNIIGERNLGLPREPDASVSVSWKDLPRGA